VPSPPQSTKANGAAWNLRGDPFSFFLVEDYVSALRFGLHSEAQPAQRHKQRRLVQSLSIAGNTKHGIVMTFLCLNDQSRRKFLTIPVLNERLIEGMRGAISPMATERRLPARLCVQRMIPFGAEGR
jgi:hypothetical protein